MDQIESDDGRGLTPRQARQSRLLSVTIANDRIGQATIIARNVSEHGLGGRTDCMLFKDEVVTLALPGLGTMEAVARWSKNGQIGLYMRERVDIGALATALKSGAKSGALEQFTPYKHVVSDSGRPSLTLAARDHHASKNRWGNR